MASSSTAVSDFTTLVSQSMFSLDHLEERTPGLGEIFAQKHFFGTLQDPCTTTLAGKGHRAGDLDRTGYGSAYLYLKLLRRVVSELLKTEQLPTKESVPLQTWLESTELAFDISAIFDDFRVGIPGCLSSLSSGQSPQGSWLFRFFDLIRSPFERDLAMTSDRITNQIDRLRPGQMLAVPGGTMDHEIVYAIQKNDDGLTFVWELDPAIGKALQIHSSVCNDPSFWTRVCRKKLIDPSISFTSTSEFQSPFHGLNLSSQIGNTCFAHCHLLFLRFFLMHQDCSASDVLKIEKTIKTKIFEQTIEDDDSLLNFARNSLKIEASKTVFAENPMAFVDTTRLLLMTHLPEMQDKIQSQLTLKSEDDNEHDLFIRSLNLIHANTKKLAARLDPNFTHSSKTSQKIVKYIQLTFEKELYLNHVFKKKTQSTLELVEESHRSRKIQFAHRLFESNILQSLLLKCRFSTRSKRDLYASLYGVNSDALFDLYYHHSDYLALLSTPEDILEWTQRVLEVLIRTEESFHLYNFIHSTFTFFMNAPFDPNDPQWIQAQEKLCMLFFYSINPQDRDGYWISFGKNFEKLIPLLEKVSNRHANAS